MKFAFLAIPLAVLTACNPAAEKPVEVAERLPQQVCDKAKEGIEELTNSAVLVLNSPTDGVIPQDVWVPMSANQKTGLVNAIGLAATCAGAPQLEQEVTIHSETGQVLDRRIVKTSYSAADAFGGADMFEER